MSTQDDSKPGHDSKAGDNIKDSAQQIWLAGLGAFAKAQQEGAKAFEALVKEGVGIQKKTQAAAEESLNQAQSRFASVATELGARATGQWGKLENIFEERVARALEKLDMPRKSELKALQARVDALEAQLHKAGSAPKPVRPARKSSATPRKSGASAASPKPSRRRSAGS